MIFKRNIFVITIIVVLIAAGVLGFKAWSNAGNRLPIQHIQGSFVVDVDNKNEVVGLVDYVFVAKVIHNKGTIHKDIVTMEDEDGKPTEVGSPYTTYTIEVVDNIKGKLKKNIPFDILKQGGITLNGQAIQMFEQDVLPEVGEYYVFLGYAQSDGSLLISGPNSNVRIKGADEQEIVSSDVYRTYQEAVENQIVTVKRERFTSDFEE